MWYFVLVLPTLIWYTIYGRYYCEMYTVAPGMWYFNLRYMVLCACIASDIWQVCGTCLRYVADTRVDRHIAALLHVEKLPADND